MSLMFNDVSSQVKADISWIIFYIIGWGRTSEGGSLPGILQHVNVPVLTLDQCRGMKYRASRITPNMVTLLRLKCFYGFYGLLS